MRPHLSVKDPNGCIFLGSQLFRTACSNSRIATLITMKKLEGKIAVVTGASKGIGASIAKHLAAEGAAVVVNYSSSKEGADRVVDEITSAGGKAIAVQAHIAKKAEIERLFSEGIAESEDRKQTEAQTPLGRIGQPQDIAPAVVFLASADSGWITGETLYITGGLH
ncbi:SDR family oxidoreductase [Microcoleus sp. N3A4]